MSITLKIGLFHLLVTDCFMCHVVIVGRYKYKWLRRDLLRVCNKFPLTQQKGLGPSPSPVTFYAAIIFCNKQTSAKMWRAPMMG